MTSDFILTHDRPSQKGSPPPEVISRQLPGSNFFIDSSSLFTVFPDSLQWGRINWCITFRVPKSSSFVGDSLTRSVTSSIRPPWGCGHQEGLSNFQTVPRFVISMPFPFTIFSSTLLFKRGILITCGILSSVRPRLGLSFSTGSTSIIFSVQNFNSSVTSKLLWAFPASKSKKGLYAIPITPDTY